MRAKSGFGLEEFSAVSHSGSLFLFQSDMGRTFFIEGDGKKFSKKRKLLMWLYYKELISSQLLNIYIDKILPGYLYKEMSSNKFKIRFWFLT